MHTPGPWKHFDDAGTTMQAYSQSSGVAGTGQHERQIICGCFRDIGGVEVASANARLISACPELLVACENVINAPGFGDEAGLADFEEIEVRLTLSTVRHLVNAVAIAKSKGNQ